MRAATERRTTRTGARAPVPVTTPASFFLLLAVVVALVVVGLVMVLSASSVQALRLYGSSWYVFKRQLIWVALGGGAMAVAMRVDYRRWRRAGLPLAVVSLGLLVLVLVPHTGISVRGSSRWVGYGDFRVQPSELAKLALLLFTADVFARRVAMASDRRRLRPVLIVLVGVIALVMAQPDMGTALVIGCVVLALLFVSGVVLMI